MKILSIDTSSNICGIALLEATKNSDNTKLLEKKQNLECNQHSKYIKLLKEISQNNGFTHSETLMPLIQELFSSQNLQLKDIDLIVCDEGPGSFTGIRIGVATAKGFSDSLNISAIGISSLEALAYNVKENGVICPLINAKNDNTYVGVFENIDGNYILKRNFSLTNIYDIINELQSVTYPITFVGDGAIAYKSIIMEHLQNSKFVEINDLSAYNLGLAGLAHFQNTQYKQPASSNQSKQDFQNNQDVLLPLYLRKSQAERMLEDKLNGK